MTPVAALVAVVLCSVGALAEDRRWAGGRSRGRAPGGAAPPSYYGLPAIHKPHWGWLIVGYFFLGGIAGGSYVLATIADSVGGRDGRPIARVGRYVSLAALIPCPVLLVLDLGRPERFHHMLRVLKLRSPMSLGTWGLLLFSGFCGASALGQAARDGVVGQESALARALQAVPLAPVGALGALPAVFVSGYTGVLLGATAVPLWAKSHLLLGPLALASATSSAAAAMTLVLALARGAPHDALARLERCERVALVAELALVVALRAWAGSVVGRPLDAAQVGRVLRWGVCGTGIAGPLALHTLAELGGKPLGQPLRWLANAMALVGGFLLRYVLVFGGRQSADDPLATFELARGTARSPDRA